MGILKMGCTNSSEVKQLTKSVSLESHESSEKLPPLKVKVISQGRKSIG